MLHKTTPLKTGGGGSPHIRNPVVRVIDKFDASYRFIDNADDYFFVQTDLNAPRGRIVLADIDQEIASVHHALRDFLRRQILHFVIRHAQILPTADRPSQSPPFRAQSRLWRRENQAPQMAYRAH